ncbi:MAG: alanine dehydrogenase [Proteobacteria bacterium]|nr:alanine dehydrogenase [Pseudomonadota bacterium]
MLIGVPKEIKSHENRVGLTDNSVRELKHYGHEIFVQSDAGAGIGITDKDYEKAGAKILKTAKEVFDAAELIVKVKEPQPEECRMLTEKHVLFAYLHLAPDPEQARLLAESNCVAIAYETVTESSGGLPLLRPMSQVAGRMSIQAGAHCLEKASGGRGVLLGGVPGVAPGHVVVIGGGIAGSNAIRMATGMHARVTVLDKSLERLRQLTITYGSKLNTIYATTGALEKYVAEADLVVGAVLVPGAAAPRLVTRSMVRNMQPGSVIVDISIDQGGCFETSRPTSHHNPTYVEEGVIHYCVVNMPGAVARTSTFALNNATLPFTIALANKGYKKALLDDEHFLNGLNVYRGKFTYKAVSEALDKPYFPAREVLGG